MSHDTLTQSDFDIRRENDELAITLVGPSNVGKSHTAQLLALEAGFKVVSIDDLIEVELMDVLRDAGYHGGIEDVASWMGQPYEPQSPANQQEYLRLETAMMHQTIDRLALPPLNGNVVIDTTGSVVHIAKEVGEEIAKHSTVVYLMATEAMKQAMFRKYIERPKPVIWGDVYNQAEGEAPADALARSYPELLERRSSLYMDLAHVAISQEVLHTFTNTDQFLTHVRNQLPTEYPEGVS